MTCPGSIALTRDAERTTNFYADEGTAAHEVAQRALTYNKPASFYIGEEIQVGHNVFVVDEDMAEHVQVYLDEVMNRVGDGTLMIEQRVEFSQSVGVPGQFGTADAIIISSDGKRATVIDLKYGMGVQVYVEENPQLLTYSAAVLETYGIVMDDVEEMEMVVVQPRLQHIDAWTCPIGRVWKHTDAMKLAAAAALEGCALVEAGGEVPDALLVPSDEGCMFCPAKATCPKLRAHVSALVYDDFKALDAPEALLVMGDPAPPKQMNLGALYGVLGLIEGWCRGVRSEVERQVMAGITIVGPDDKPMKVVEGKRGNRSWKDEKEAEALLAGFVAADKLYKPRKLISPADADKLLKKQKDIIVPLVQQAPGKPHVAFGSDPRPPYVASADADEFADLGEQS
jgi:hypothetical protein